MNQKPTFKLGINLIPRDLTMFQSIPNKPIILPRKSQPDIFFTPIEDNRDQILERMKRELDYQLEITKNTLPRRY